MSRLPSERLDPRVLSVWRWTGAVFSGLSFVVVGGVEWLTWKYGFSQIYAGALFAAALIETVLLVFIAPRLRFVRWRYEVREDEIELMRGVVFVERTIIPMVRIQHVDTVQGPLLRKYGLTGVRFSTAAGSHEIPALDNETADRVRDRIAALAKVSDEDV